MSFRWIGSALALCLSVGCAVPVRAPSAPAFDPSAAAILVYLEPPLAEARRLSASLATLEAVREDGGRIPLRLENPSVGGKPSQVPHRLAAGSLPPGRYAGLELTLSEATLANEDGKAVLGLPDGPTRVVRPFTATAGSGTVVELQLDLKAALADGYRFQPAFAATIPARIPVGLVGLASVPEEGLVVTFDRRSGRVTAVTPVGRRPVGIAIDAVRRRGYVALAGDDALVAIDLERGTVAERRPLRGGDRPVDLALFAGGTRLLVANEGSSSAVIVEATGLAEVGRVLVGEAPVAVLVREQPEATPGTTVQERLFVACRRGNRIDELFFDAEKNEWIVVRSAGTDPGPFRLQFNRARDRIYAAQEDSPYLSVARLYDVQRRRRSWRWRSGRSSAPARTRFGSILRRTGSTWPGAEPERSRSSIRSRCWRSTACRSRPTRFSSRSTARTPGSWLSSPRGVRSSGSAPSRAASRPPCRQGRGSHSPR